MSVYAGFEHIVRENEPLSRYTRLNLGGVAEYFSEPTNAQELAGLVKAFHEANMPVRLIGDGSNVLIRSEGVPGLVLHLGAPAFMAIEVNDNRMKVGGGAKLSHFVSTAVREGLSGPEQLVGIPGTVGGALHSNTGAHGVDIGTWVVEAEVLTRNGELITRDRESLTFSYRQSSLDELVIVSATFEFEKEHPADLTRQMQKIWIVRRAAQPITDRRAAYIFKDQGGNKANDLIDAAGLKGTRIGEVEVSDTDPNVFVASEGATSDDVMRLMDLVKTQVSERLSVELEPAIQIW